MDILNAHTDGWLPHVLHGIIIGIECIGAMIISVGTFIILFNLLRAMLRGRFRHELRPIRLDFGGYLVMGLEFLIAADILKTVIAPTLEEIGLLGGVIVIRTVLSLSIAWEIKQTASPLAKMDHRAE